jgi:hypothetical protein
VRQWINDLAENSIQTWFDMQNAFTENFEGIYKRPHNIGELQRYRREENNTSMTFLARWLDMKNSCEGVTDKSAILAFIDSLERDQLTSCSAIADDDARESLKASAIQNNGWWNNNSYKRKSPPEEQHTPDIVATTFSERGQGGQRGRGRSSSSGQQRSPTAPAAAPTAPISYNEYRDMPCFAHRNAAGKCNHSNRNYKFVNDIKADQEAGYKRTRRPRPCGKGKADKDKKSKDDSDMENDLAPKISEKTEAGASGSNPFKNPKGTYHAFLGPPTTEAQRAVMRSL